MERAGKFENAAHAFAVVERLKSAHGVWSGVVLHADGSASILHEPDMYSAPRRDRTPEPADDE